MQVSAKFKDPALAGSLNFACGTHSQYRQYCSFRSSPASRIPSQILSFINCYFVKRILVFLSKKRAQGHGVAWAEVIRPETRNNGEVGFTGSLV
ncbi:MAG: hypothetical protein A3C81_03045 [Candidatus Yanofskybacteria bacterium RIFCSPHIGHO2_02_FULL_46_19]|uniref:Uncharacterized protein n=1 Tax=Candidatus Yanofskybacteria bacterium RIFCSPHIGHO2_02_FULL_46_19 TaxID=1802684 RepID=A0A1F8FT62_9BACT|nr:MAG: hypothetical protein A3C81_03045 [Candidatus Yanofskybacteria bacterium RIFCSPHIGHO2_02_FULL_46_19]